VGFKKHSIWFVFYNSNILKEKEGPKQPADMLILILCKAVKGSWFGCVYSTEWFAMDALDSNSF
jgi:hypothetical protein